MNGRPIVSANKQRSYNGDYMDKGRLAEEIVLEFLRVNPYVVGVEDFRELRPVHEADIDFAIKTYDGRVTLAEVKHDYHLGVSGRVLFEVLRINHTAHSDVACTLGWSARSPATYFLYYAPQPHKIYKCRSDDLRAAFQKYTQEVRKSTNISYIETDNIKSTVNILIPWSYCEDIFTVYDAPNIAHSI